jgi:hypothetical protein
MAHACPSPLLVEISLEAIFDTFNAMRKSSACPDLVKLIA